MSDSEIHHLGAAYALDALDDSERRAFEAHFASCEICRQDVREFRDTAAELGALTAAPAPADLKARVMAEIAVTRQLSPLPDTVVRLADRRPSRSMMAVLGAAAAVLCFVAGALVVATRSNDGFGDRLAAMMSEPDSRTVRLGGEGAGTVTVVLAGGRAAVVGDGLAVPAAGTAYELWAIDSTGAHPLRLLDRADDGTLRRIVDVPVEPAALGVTIEPDSGSPTPTEPILYSAEV
jgi:anti-sigma-K factor RskA